MNKTEEWYEVFVGDYGTWYQGPAGERLTAHIEHMRAEEKGPYPPFSWGIRRIQRGQKRIIDPLSRR